MESLLRLGVALLFTVGCSSPDGGPVIDENCTFAVRYLGVQLKAGERCLSVVRLDYTTFEPLGLHVACGTEDPIDEATARSLAYAETGYGAEGQQVAEEGSGLFVFFEPPFDFGGAAVVSATTGQTVFGGGIVWAGRGQITYPSTWSMPSAFPDGCASPQPLSVAPRRVSLTDERSIDDDTLRTVLDTVWATSLSTALETHGVLNGVTVILYPPTVGSFEPANAEWLVIFDSGPGM